MFGWNNDPYQGGRNGRGNRGQGRGRRAGNGFGPGAGFGPGRGRGRSGRGFGFGPGRGLGGAANTYDNGFGGYGRGYGCGFGGGYGGGYGNGYAQGRFDGFGQGRMGRGPCGMGLNRFRPGRGGAFRAAMDNGPVDGVGPDTEFCPLCEQHCPLSAPSCPKGEAYAARMGRP